MLVNVAGAAGCGRVRKVHQVRSGRRVRSGARRVRGIHVVAERTAIRWKVIRWGRSRWGWIRSKDCYGNETKKKDEH